jgi:hypothetical protein
MSTRSPQQIYRLRRTIAVAALLAIVGLVWWGIGVMRGDTSAANKPAPSEVVPTGPIKACAPGAVVVQAFVGDGNADQTQFAAGVNPMIWFSLINNSKVPCTFEAGSIGQFYTITTGPDTVWQSSQCDRTQDVSAVVTLQPKVAMSSPASAWYRVQSSSTGCGKGQKAVVAGGASYHLTVTVNGVKSSNDVQFVLN